MEWRPACVAGKDAEGDEGTQVEAQAARQAEDLSQDQGASESRWEREH